MKIEDAIEYLNDPIGKGMDEHNEAVNIALFALEKRIPQKTMYGHSTYADWRECSVCGSQVTRNATVKDKYCRNCGQATDWEELK